MSSSDILRKSISGKTIFNEKAKKQEQNLSQTIKNLILELEQQFPGITFSWNKRIYKKEIAQNINKPNWQPCSQNPFIQPDGGILYATINGKTYPILVSEAKKQGTNDILEQEGKQKQSKGNAIERSVKNHSELRLFFTPFDFYPYVIFASGCDFEGSSSINDRLDCLTNYEPRNLDYSLHPEKLATVFIREKTWTTEEIHIKIKEITLKVIHHILKSNER